MAHHLLHSSARRNPINDQVADTPWHVRIVRQGDCSYEYRIALQARAVFQRAVANVPSILFALGSSLYYSRVFA
eukprot:scaffold42618_cov36-Prasinocladus_malaysianus.AAC.1